MTLTIVDRIKEMKELLDILYKDQQFELELRRYALDAEVALQKIEIYLLQHGIV